jgi:hypothetical protein
MAAIDYYNTGDDAWLNCSAYWRAQTFTASQSYDIQSVKLWMYRSGSPGTITVSIRATTAGAPSGADLASVEFNTTTDVATTPGGWVEITFDSSYSLTSGSVYAIVVEKAGSTLYWRSDDTSPAYGGGDEWYSDNGSAWYEHSGRDMMFETYEVPAEVDLTGTITGSGTVTGTLATTEELTGTISGSGTIIGTLTTFGGLPNNRYAIQRLILFGSNGLYYEDI